jgi:hypothetical protein
MSDTSARDPAPVRTPALPAGNEEEATVSCLCEGSGGSATKDSSLLLVMLLLVLLAPAS